MEEGQKVMLQAMLQASICDAPSNAFSNARYATLLTQLTQRIQDSGSNTQVPDPSTPVDKSDWVTAELHRISVEAAELTPEHVDSVCRKFRTEIGGVYAHIADYLEAVHA